MTHTPCGCKRDEHGPRRDRLRVPQLTHFHRALRWIGPIVVAAGVVGANCHARHYDRPPPHQVVAHGWPVEHSFHFVLEGQVSTSFSSLSSVSSHRIFLWEECAIAACCALILVLSTLYVMTTVVHSSKNASQFSLSQLLLFMAAVAAMLSSRRVLDALSALLQKPIWIIVPVAIGLICVPLAATSVASRLFHLPRRLTRGVTGSAHVD